MALLVMALAACGDRPDDVGSGNGGPAGGAAGVGDGDELRGRVFLSTKVTEGGSPRPMADGTVITLQFVDDGRLLANAGCNMLQGPVRLSGDTLGVSDLSTTDMGCDPPRHEQDTWLHGFLTAAPTVRLDDTTLTLASGGTEIVLVDREVAQPDVALEGTTWIVDTLLSADVASSMPAGATATLTFDAGTVAVSTGCNTGTGTYQVDGQKLTFSDVVLTRMGCEPHLMQVEQAVVAALNGETTYEIDSDRLAINHPTGTGLQLTAKT